MYTKTSESFNEKVQELSRTFSVKLEFDNLTITDNVRKVSVSGGSNATGALAIGVTACACAEIEVSGTVAVSENQMFSLSFGLKLSEDNFEFIPYGKYIVNSVEITEEKDTKITAYDLMFLAESTYVSTLTYPTTAIKMLDEICSNIGITRATTGLGTINISEAPVGYTMREILGYLAGLYGKFAVIDREGKLQIKWYEDNGAALDYDHIKEPKLGDANYSLNSISILNGETVVYSVGEGNGISFENPYMSLSILNNIWSTLQGFEFTPAQVEVLIADPRLDVWDMITLLDAEFPCMEYRLEYDGGVSATVTASAESTTEGNVGYRSPETIEKQRIKQDLLDLGKIVAEKASIADLEVTNSFISRVESTADEALEGVNNLENDVDKQFQKYSTTVEMNSAIEQKANSIMTTVSETFDPTLNQSGSLITITDSAELPLVGLTLHGNTTQDGTPSPEAKADLVSNENPVVTITGKNLLENTATTQTVNGVTFTVNDDKSITANGTTTADATIRVCNSITLPIGRYTLTGCPSGGSTSTYDLRYGTSGATRDTGTGVSFSVTEPSESYVAIIIRSGVTVSNLTFYPMIRLATIEDDTYEPYKSQTLSVPYTLNGVGDVRDYVDFEKGVLVRNCAKVVIDENTTLTTHNYSSEDYLCVIISTNIAGAGTDRTRIFCSHFEPISRSSELGTVDGVYFRYENATAPIIISIKKSISADIESFRAWAIENNLEIVYPVATPTEKPLTAEELEAYKQLHTYKPYTTIINSEGAEMDVIYVNQTYSDMQGNLEERVTKAEATLEVQAQKIEAKVDVDGVISAINLAKGEATINANKINFNGVVTANETFKILEDGSMVATGGTIGGWNIEKQRLYGESEKQPDTEAFYRVSLARPYTYDPRHNVFLVEQIGEGVALLCAITAGGQAMFSSLNVTGNTSLYGDVYSTGNLTAKNFQRGTLEVVASSATVYVTKEIPLSFTPTETTQCVLTLRTTGSPQPRYLNCWANYFKASDTATPILQACLTAGGSSASTVPAGTYYIDYIAANV